MAHLLEMEVYFIFQISYKKFRMFTTRIKTSTFVKPDDAITKPQNVNDK